MIELLKRSNLLECTANLVLIQFVERNMLHNQLLASVSPLQEHGFAIDSVVFARSSK